MAQLKSKEVKRAALNELIDHITTAKGVLTEPAYPEIVKMVIITPSLRIIIFEIEIIVTHYYLLLWLLVDYFLSPTNYK